MFFVGFWWKMGAEIYSSWSWSNCQLTPTYRLLLLLMSYSGKRTTCPRDLGERQRQLLPVSPLCSADWMSPKQLQHCEQWLGTEPDRIANGEPGESSGDDREQHVAAGASWCIVYFCVCLWNKIMNNFHSFTTANILKLSLFLLLVHVDVEVVTAIGVEWI